MGIKERQERDREAVRRAILDAARELFVTEGLPERLDPQDRRAHRIQPGRHLRLLPEQGRHLLRARRRRASGCSATRRRSARTRSSRTRRRSTALRAIFWRLYEFSREQPQYFALMFVDRSVPRISREYERFAFAREHEARTSSRSCRRASTPASCRRRSTPSVAMRALMVGVLGVAVLRLSRAARARRRRRPARRRRAEPDARRPALRRRRSSRRRVTDCPLDDRTDRRCSGFITPRSCS